MQRQPADDRIAYEVRRALQIDSRLAEESIDVHVQDGVVRLVGYVATPDQRQIAVRIAGRLAGVRDVVDELAVVPRGRSDVDVTADVVVALSQRPELPIGGIDVATVDGVVHLRGTVPSETARKVAEDTARGVDGVADVVDELLVEPPSPRTETEIADDVHQRITHLLRIEPERIAVRVENGVAILRGTVPSAELRMLADEVARWTPGVTEVRNQLVVHPEAA